jgi:hypothetical protein
MNQQEGGENGTMRSMGGRIILKQTSKKEDRGAQTGFIWLRTGPPGGL